MKMTPIHALKPFFLLTLTALLAVGLPPQADAAMVTFDLLWDGGETEITADGYVTFDDSLNDGSNHLVGLPHPLVGDLSITIAGTFAGSGAGTFTLANGDFSNLMLSASEVLDFTQELVGQAGFNGFSVNIGTPVGNAPYGEPDNYDRIVTEGGGGYLLNLISMAPRVAQVPEPATLALFAAGLAGFGIRRRAA